MESQNFVVWVGRDFPRTPSPTPCNELILLDQVDKSPIQPSLGCFQGWGIRDVPNAWYKAPCAAW